MKPTSTRGDSTPPRAMTWNQIQSKARVLVVDDDRDALRLMERMLWNAGYQKVATVSDPRAVRGIFETNEPDLVLLDLSMPGRDECEVLEEMQELVPAADYLPVMVITAHLDNPAVLRALAAGAKDFQTKPVDFVELLLRMRILIETRFRFKQLQQEAAFVSTDSRIERRDAYLRTVIDTVPDVIFAQDANGRIRMANQATARVLGSTVDLIVGRLHREVSPRIEDVARLEEQIREALAEGSGNTVERCVTHPVTGETHWFETRVVPLCPPDGDCIQALVVGTDLTDRRRAEEAVRVSHREVLARLAQAAEYRDDDTGKHTRRVGALAAEIARLLGLTESEVELIRQAAPLHDIGKIGIPDSMLLKPGKLTEDEYATMKRHTLIGGRILSGSTSELMMLAEQIAMAHHERWDGMGYPHGLREDENVSAARIVCVADVVDALSHERPYRPAWAPDRVIEELRHCRGRFFDPLCVDACLEIIGSKGDWSMWAEA